ncbi:MAG: hypothetical protein R2708_26660 [Vicinamibacterales bacterium]
MFSAAMGQPTQLRQETLDVAGESLVVATLGIGNPQCVALLPDLPDRAPSTAWGRTVDAPAVPPAPTSVAVVEPPAGCAS